MNSSLPYSVVFASDARGLLPLTVAAWSLLEAAGGQTVYHVYILSDGIPAQEQERIHSLLSRAGSQHEVRFLDIGDVFTKYLNINEEIWTAAHWPRVAWARIALAELLPDVSRTLYLDIDTLVCTDLAPLFATDMGDAALGVVLEHESHEHSHFNERLGIPQECPGYFNSGVLLMNLNVFRRDGLVKKVMDYAWEHSDVLICPDQDALNGALCDRLCRLHPRWNWHDGLTRQILKWDSSARLWRGNSPKESIEAALYPGILHYQGRHKPWRYNHRIERARYEDSMLHAGVVEKLPLPGWSLGEYLRRLLYAPLYAYTWRRIARLARKFGVSGSPS